MNDRINELVGKAGAVELGADLYGGEYIGAIRADFLEKFAGLIVAEYELQIQLLITRAEKENTRLLAGNGEYSGKLAVPVDQLTKIKQHFGVEE